MEKLAFYSNKKMRYVTVIRTSNKNMYLKVKGNELVVSAPKRVKEKYIREFVMEHLDKFTQYLEDKKETILFSIKDNFLYLLGKKYPLVSLTGFPNSSVIVKGKSAYIHSLDGSDSSIEKAVKDFLKKDLTRYITKRILHFEKLMNLPPHTIRVVYKTATWGTNKIGTNKLSFSSRLGHYRREITDYVIVHELAHTIESNHQEAFWKVVNTYIDNSKELRKELKADQTLNE